MSINKNHKKKIKPKLSRKVFVELPEPKAWWKALLLKIKKVFKLNDTKS